MTRTLDRRIDDDATRRQFLTLLGAAGLLAGCGTDDGAESAPPEPATRTFVDSAGRSVEVPNRPQRIVAVHDTNGGLQVLELGFSLVGMATRGGGFDPGGPVSYDFADVTPVGEYYEPNVEAIAALNPDLIVGESFEGEAMGYSGGRSVGEAVEQLAPTVYIDTFRPVDEVMADFAELLGVQDRLAEIAGDYETDLAALREELAPVTDRLTATFVVMRADAMLGLRGESATPLTVTLTALGIEQSPATDAEGPDGFPKLSLELIPQVGADVIFLEGPGGDDDFFADYTANPLWQGLDAVAVGQVHPTDERMYPQTYATYAFVLDEVRAALVGADPDVFDEGNPS